LPDIRNPKYLEHCLVLLLDDILHDKDLTRFAGGVENVNFILGILNLIDDQDRILSPLLRQSDILVNKLIAAGFSHCENRYDSISILSVMLNSSGFLKFKPSFLKKIEDQVLFILSSEQENSYYLRLLNCVLEKLRYGALKFSSQFTNKLFELLEGLPKSADFLISEYLPHLLVQHSELFSISLKRSVMFRVLRLLKSHDNHDNEYVHYRVISILLPVLYGMGGEVSRESLVSIDLEMSNVLQNGQYCKELLPLMMKLFDKRPELVCLESINIVISLFSEGGDIQNSCENVLRAALKLPTLDQKTKSRILHALRINLHLPILEELADTTPEHTQMIKVLDLDTRNLGFN